MQEIPEVWNGAQFALHVDWKRHQQRIEVLEKQIAEMRTELADFEKAVEERRRWMREIEEAQDKLLRPCVHVSL